MKRRKKIKVIINTLKETSLGLPLDDKEYYYIANKIVDDLKEEKRK